MQQHQPQQPQSNNFLLRLPGELRNNIYDLVLLENLRRSNGGQPITSPMDQGLCELRTMSIPALARTCRQIQREAISYMFHHAKWAYTVVIDRNWKLHVQYSRHTISILKMAGLQDFKFQHLTFRLVNPMHFDPAAMTSSKSTLVIRNICTVSRGRLIKYDLTGGPGVGVGEQGVIWEVQGRPMDVFWNRIERCALDVMEIATIERVAGLVVEATALKKFLTVGRTAKTVDEVARRVDRVVSFGRPVRLDFENYGTPYAAARLLSIFTADPILSVGSVVKRSGYWIVRKRWKIRKACDRLKRPFDHGRVSTEMDHDWNSVLDISGIS